MANAVTAGSRAFLSTAAFSTNPNAPSSQALSSSLVGLVATQSGVSASALLVATATLAAHSPRIRVTQHGLEVVTAGSADIRVTQHGLEVVEKSPSNIRVTQHGLEVITTLGGIHIVPAFVQFSKAGIQARTINAFARFQGSISKPIFVYAVIGLRRTISVLGWFQGNSKRGITCYAYFKEPGLVPCRASFWVALANWNIVSDSQTKVMSQASHVIGGSIGSYFGYPSANNAPTPANWSQAFPTYNDNFWPYAVTYGESVAFPPDNVLGHGIAFDWRWPNATGDYAPEPGGGTAAPFFEQVMYRRDFGLPSNPRVALNTSVNLQVAMFGVFGSSIMEITVNGIAVPGSFLNPIGTGASLLWQGTVAGTTLLPGSNVLAFRITSEFSFSVDGRVAVFRMLFSYKPPSLGMSQVLG